MKALRSLGGIGLVLGICGASTAPWGTKGHEMAARAAIETMPLSMPAFFRDAADQLIYLGPEPDRWRVRSAPEMDQAWNYDHYIDLENVPEGALDAPDRFVYLRRLYEAGLDRPERDAGFLPYAILELYQRLATEWRLWAAETDPDRRAWIAQRIVNDAGILGHYVTDGSQPHHTTIHFNGWAADAPNPQGYTTDRRFHSRFEASFVNAHVELDDVRARMPAAPRAFRGREEVRSGVMGYLTTTHDYVDDLYRIDRDAGFDTEGAPQPESKEFAAQRLASGGAMLATLWWSAWLEGLDPTPR